MRHVAFGQKDDVSIDAPTVAGLERQILFAPESTLIDEDPEIRSSAIKDAILTALACDPHSVALRRVLVQGECLSVVARDFDRKASRFAMSVFPAFKRRLRHALKEAGISVAVEGRADARVVRRLYAAMMEPSPTAGACDGHTRFEQN